MFKNILMIEKYISNKKTIAILFLIFTYQTLKITSAG